MMIEEFAKVLEAARGERYAQMFGTETPDLLNAACKVEVKYGGKYARVNVGRSGVYMIPLPGQPDAGTIFGIKAAGVIHRGHRYGTLETVEDWHWGGYTATRRR